MKEREKEIIKQLSRIIIRLTDVSPRAILTTTPVLNQVTSKPSEPSF